MATKPETGWTWLAVGAGALFAAYLYSRRPAPARASDASKPLPVPPEPPPAPPAPTQIPNPNRNAANGKTYVLPGDYVLLLGGDPPYANALAGLLRGYGAHVDVDVAQGDSMANYPVLNGKWDVILVAVDPADRATLAQSKASDSTLKTHVFGLFDGGSGRVIYLARNRASGVRKVLQDLLCTGPILGGYLCSRYIAASSVFGDVSPEDAAAETSALLQNADPHQQSNVP